MMHSFYDIYKKHIGDKPEVNRFMMKPEKNCRNYRKSSNNFANCTNYNAFFFLLRINVVACVT